MPVATMLPVDEDAAPPVSEAHAAPVARSDVRGLVDNATADRLYGWAWDAAHPGYRVKVELRLAGEVVATTVADIARPDLAKHGVGDGCHAFEFTLLRKWFKQLRDLSAVAYGKDGSEFPVPVHARQQDEMLVPAQASAQLQSMADALLAEHQGVRKEIEALRQRSAQLPDIATVEAIAKAGHDLQRRLDSLELWLTRLDGKLAEVAVPASPEGRRRLDTWQVVLIALLVGALSVAGTLMLTYSGT
jgi:hypothetical protein